jgi:hypothetical protein
MARFRIHCKSAEVDSSNNFTALMASLKAKKVEVLASQNHAYEFSAAGSLASIEEIFAKIGFGKDKVGVVRLSDKRH